MGLDAGLRGDEVRGGLRGLKGGVSVHQLSVTHWYKLPCGYRTLVGIGAE